MAVPTWNIVLRVLMVESQYGRGTIFSIDVDEREYWITARHIVTGAEGGPPYGSITNKSLPLSVLNADATSDTLQWFTVNFTVIGSGDENVDIVVIAAPTLILDNPMTSMTASSDGAVFGGDCEFLGFAYGGGWRAPLYDGKKRWLPFVKHCTISAHVTDEKMWVLDGINNQGFSGGPVIFGEGLQQKILGLFPAIRQSPLR